MKEAIIKLLDEVNAVVIGLHPGEYTVLGDLFKHKHPNHFFNPKYKAKIWDGNIRFFSKNGKTYVKLLPEIIPVLTNLGYSIKIVDKRDNVQISVPEIDKMYLADFGWELGEHQVEGINALTKGNGGMLKAGTGAGKTVCCWVLHDLYYNHCGYETLVIVPTKDLIHQTVAEFNEFSPDVGFWGDSKKSIDYPVVVSTWQTLMNQGSFVSRYKHIIMDECHGGKDFNSQINKIMNEYGINCYVKMGMTGTFPLDACSLRTLQCAMGQIVYEIPAKELIDSGWSASMQLTLLCMDEDLRPDYEAYKLTDDYKKIISEGKKCTFTDYKKALFPEFAGERAHLAKNFERNSFIASFVSAKTVGSGSSVILVNTLKQGLLLEELIPGSKFIQGKNKSTVRREMFELFSEEDDVIMITTYGLAAVGLNIRRIFNLFMVDAGSSFIRVIQTIGRGLRKAHDKSVVNVYDIYSNFYFSERHLRERVGFYEQEGHTINKRLNVKYKGTKDKNDNT